MNQEILEPMLATMMLTFIVWVVMYIFRFQYIIANKISAKSISSPELLNSVLPEKVNRPSNNFKNLFELPVIFYVVCLALFVLQRVDGLFLNLAWFYVALRVIHSVVHCTVNIVPLRFAAYALSGIILWIMVIRLALLVL